MAETKVKNKFFDFAGQQEAKKWLSYVSWTIGLLIALALVWNYPNIGVINGEFR